MSRVSRVRAALAPARSAARPPPRLSVAAWADRYRKLSPEASAEPGQWRNARAPHTVAPMDALSPTDPTQVVVLKFSAQSAKTEVGLNFLGYIASQDPGPVLSLQPNEKPMAEAFSKDRVAPMIRDTPALTNRFGTAVGRTSANTILHKGFVGGHLTIAGANSPSSLASRPIRYIFADEINRWEPTKEGDPLGLAIKRTRTFWNRKILIVSTPTLEGVGISFEYERTLQHEWRLACFDCGEVQMPAFRHFSFDRGADGTLGAVRYACEHCGTVHDERSERRIKGSGAWVIVNEADPRRKGYHFNQWCSPFAAWRETIQEFLDAKDDPAKLQIVVNTAFAEEWKGVGEQLEPDKLYARRMAYPMADDERLAVPDEVEQLVLLVDTQDTYLDYEVVGVDDRKRSWGIEKGQIVGQTDEEGPWEALDALLERSWPTEGGGELGLFAAMIDIQGHRQKLVKQFVYERRARKLYAFSGMGSGVKKQVARSRDRLEGGSRKRVDVWQVRVDDFKADAAVYLSRSGDRLGACHWPRRSDGGVIAGYDEEIFAQLCAEKLVETRTKGFAKKTWEKTRPRNEAWDLRHMLYALLAICPLPSGRVRTRAAPQGAPPADEDKPARAPQQRDERGRWVRRAERTPGRRAARAQSAGSNWVRGRRR